MLGRPVDLLSLGMLTATRSKNSKTTTATAAKLQQHKMDIKIDTNRITRFQVAVLAAIADCVVLMLPT